MFKPQALWEITNSKEKFQWENIICDKYMLRLTLYRASAFFRGIDLLLRVPGGKIGVCYALYTTQCGVRHAVTERSPDSGVKPEFKFEFFHL